MLDTLQTELRNQALTPPGGDKRIAAFCTAVAQELCRPQFRAVVERMFASRTGLSPSYAVNIMLRALQKQLLRSSLYSYPLDYTEAATWQDEIVRVLDDPALLSEYSNDLMLAEVQSNVVERYKAFKLVMLLLRNTIGDMPSVLDVGCSRNLGLKKLALNLPFRPIRIAAPLRIRDTTLVALQDYLNGLLRQKVALSYGIGSDIVHIDSINAAIWARSCSFYPAELLDLALVSEYDYLDHNAVYNVDFERGDFVSGGLTSPFEYEHTFAVVTVSTFMYQLSVADRERVRSTLRRYVASDGIIIYQDFAKASEDQSSLTFEDHWFATHFPYRTLIEFASDPSRRLHELFRWDNGRCNNVILGQDFNAIVGNHLFEFTNST